MPTRDHEIPIDLFRQRPALAAEVLTDILGVPVPSFTQADVGSETLTQHTPTEFFADLVVTLRWYGKPVMAVIVEVQLARDTDKRFSWPVYLATVRQREKCPVALLVVCPDKAIAAWCAKRVDCGPGWSINPLALALASDGIPAITDPDRAVQAPELAVLSALGHGDDPDRGQILHALLKGLDTLDTDRQRLYLDYVFERLSQAAGHDLETLMTTNAHEYKSDFARTYYGQGRADGEAKGEAIGSGMLLKILSLRGIAVSDEARERIAACTDLDQLDAWGDRALTATTIDDLFT